VLNGSLSLMVEETAGVVLIREEVKAGNAHQPTRQRIELAIGVMLRLMRQFLGAGWKPQRVCFEHPAPRDLSVHHRLFGRCVEFNADFNCIVCAKADLDVRNPFADPAMARYAGQLLHPDRERQEADVTARVRELIVTLLGNGRCTIDVVAKHLGMDRRTVHRRLADQGTTYSEMLDSVRRELAPRYMENPERTLAQVSTLLGFSAPSGFSRWYRRQFKSAASEGRVRRLRGSG